MILLVYSLTFICLIHAHIDQKITDKLAPSSCLPKKIAPCLASFIRKRDKIASSLNLTPKNFEEKHTTDPQEKDIQPYDQLDFDEEEQQEIHLYDQLDFDEEEQQEVHLYNQIDFDKKNQQSKRVAPHTKNRLMTHHHETAIENTSTPSPKSNKWVVKLSQVFNFLSPSKAPHTDLSLVHTSTTNLKGPLEGPIDTRSTVTPPPIKTKPTPEQIAIARRLNQLQKERLQLNIPNNKESSEASDYCVPINTITRVSTPSQIINFSKTLKHIKDNELYSTPFDSIEHKNNTPSKRIYPAPSYPAPPEPTTTNIKDTQTNKLPHINPKPENEYSELTKKSFINLTPENEYDELTINQQPPQISSAITTKSSKPTHPPSPETKNIQQNTSPPKRIPLLPPTFKKTPSQTIQTEITKPLPPTPNKPNKLTTNTKDVPKDKQKNLFSHASAKTLPSIIHTPPLKTSFSPTSPQTKLKNPLLPPTLNKTPSQTIQTEITKPLPPIPPTPNKPNKPLQETKEISPFEQGNTSVQIQTKQKKTIITKISSPVFLQSDIPILHPDMLTKQAQYQDVSQLKTKKTEDLEGVHSNIHNTELIDQTEMFTTKMPIHYKKSSHQIKFQA